MVSSSAVSAIPFNATGIEVLDLFIQKLMACEISATGLDYPSDQLTLIALHHYCVMHLVPRMSSIIDDHLGLWFEGPAQCGKTTTLSLMPSYTPCRDATGCGMFSNSMPVHNFEDCTVDYCKRHDGTLRPLILNTKVSTKVFGSTNTLTGKWVVVTTNDKISDMPPPDRRRWIALKFSPLESIRSALSAPRHEFLSALRSYYVDTLCPQMADCTWFNSVFALAYKQQSINQA